MFLFKNKKNKYQFHDLDIDFWGDFNEKKDYI